MKQQHTKTCRVLIAALLYLCSAVPVCAWDIVPQLPFWPYTGSGNLCDEPLRVQHQIPGTHIDNLAQHARRVVSSAAPEDNPFVFDQTLPYIKQSWYFHLPKALATGFGRVYVADTENNRIMTFTPLGMLLYQWGSGGSGNGMFKEPMGIACAGPYVYVVDTGNHRVQKFDSSGAYKSSFGNKGTTDGLFENPSSIAGCRWGRDFVIYVADDSRVQKFTDNGTSVQHAYTWHISGTAGLAVNPATGMLYVVNAKENRIETFKPDNTPDHSLGGKGTVPGKFQNPTGIAIDSYGNIYIADTGNGRIQKLCVETAITKQDKSVSNNFRAPLSNTFRRVVRSVTGALRNPWVTWQGPFSVRPGALAADAAGNLYIAGGSMNSIWKLRGDGTLADTWSTRGTGKDGWFNSPAAVAADGAGNFYVADTDNHQIQKFSDNGSQIKFVKCWGTQGDGKNQFQSPRAIAVQGKEVYVADSRSVQRFIVSGSDVEFKGKWSKYISGLDTGGNPVYEPFDSPAGIAVDPERCLYVSEPGKSRIIKFHVVERDLKADSQMPFMGGSGTGLFSSPAGIAWGGNYLYVADNTSNIVFKCADNGKCSEFIAPEGSDAARLDHPRGVSIDADGDVYVTDSGNSRVQVFDRDGTFKKTIGSFGSGPGRARIPAGAAVAQAGGIKTVYVADTGNSRILVFRGRSREWLVADQRKKAIIIAGSGPSDDDALWPSIRALSYHAYTTLLNRGFTDETICFLTYDNAAGPDNEKIVDGPPNLSNVRCAITKWAKRDCSSLVIYLVDHGDSGDFILDFDSTNSVDKHLYYRDLNTWINELQDTLPGQVIVLNDSCKSGSMIDAFGNCTRRISVTSTDNKTKSQWGDYDLQSFSGYFWNNIANGLCVLEAFKIARDVFIRDIPGQQRIVSDNPCLDDNGNGRANEPFPSDGRVSENTYVGRGPIIDWNAPRISSLSLNPDGIIQQTDQAKLTATVWDAHGVRRVWADIYGPSGNQFIPPAVVEMSEASGTSSPITASARGTCYEAVLNDPNNTAFTKEGSYWAFVYAKDDLSNTCAPQRLQIDFKKPLRSKAMIVAGENSDIINTDIINNIVRMAYTTLSECGYSDTDIYYLRKTDPTDNMREKIDAPPSLDIIKKYLADLKSDDTSDLLIYLIGSGNDNGFQINSNETLKPEDLYDCNGQGQEWCLDKLQKRLSPNTVTLVCDFPGSGLRCFIDPTRHPYPDDGKPIVMASSSFNEIPYYAAGGPSFSSSFWMKVLAGYDLYSAFLTAQNDIDKLEICNMQWGLIDDFNSRYPNECCSTGHDGVTAKRVALGQYLRSQMWADDEAEGCVPLPGEKTRGTCPSTSSTSTTCQRITGLSRHTAWLEPRIEKASVDIDRGRLKAEGVMAGATVKEVWAVVVPPNHDFTKKGGGFAALRSIHLEKGKKNCYEGIYSNFNQTGVYKVIMFVMDANGMLSPPAVITVEKE